jgi:hypothetical protein
MPRPKKKGFEYFPLDTDLFSNRKVKNLRRAHGAVGILTYINLMCKVYKKGYFFEFNDIDELCNDIAEEITNTQVERTARAVAETINYLVGRGILSEGLFERGIISGEALQEQYVISAYKAKRKIEMDEHCLVDVLAVVRKIRVSSEETTLNSEEMTVNSEFGTQSKVKYNNTTTTFIFSAREREENVEKSVEKPSFDIILQYMYDIGAGNPEDETRKFMDYNDVKKWKCMPEWKAACRLWVAREG